MPVSTADDPDFKGTKTNCTQYDGHVIESTGLIKMDFLGLKTLSELKEACANIKRTRGIDVDLDTIPIDDPKTYELYQKGQTIGTFQFESSLPSSPVRTVVRRSNTISTAWRNT